MALVGLLGGQSHAQPALEDDELAAVLADRAGISLATGSRQPLRRAPAVATVITAADIAAMGATELDQVLESVPGLHVGRSNQANSPLYVIRGVYSEFNPQTLMLHNGVPVTTLLVGNRGNVWGGLPVENIARIEVIRGPGSALHGADAYSGVINIVTKTAQDAPGTEIGVRAGSFASREGWVHHGGTWGPLQLAAYLRLGRTDGYRRTIEADAQTALDALFATRASLAPGPMNNGLHAVDAGLDLALEAWRWRTHYKLRDDVRSGTGVAGALDPLGRARSRRVVSDLSRQGIVLGPGWTLALTASLLHFEQTIPVPFQLLPPGAFGGAFPQGMIGAPETWERQRRLSAVTTYSAAAGHLVRIGLGHDDLNLYASRELKNFSLVASGPLIGLPVPLPGGQVQEAPVAQSFIGPHRRRLNYLLLQDEWSFRRDWTLTAGVRHDRYTDAGSTTNPRLALVWDTSLNLTSKLLVGRAFRAPSFNEQYGVNPVASGNPAVRPETIQSIEAAFAWQARGDLMLNLSLYHHRLRDMIRIAEGSAVFGNTGAQQGRGFELEAVWQPRRGLRLSGHLALQRSIDDATGQDAAYAPRRHLWARADWRAGGGWQASAQLNHVGGRHRAVGDPRPRIADNTTVDLALHTPQPGRGWALSASVRNLFDADVREPSLAPGQSLPYDLPQAGRAVSLQAVYRH